MDHDVHKFSSANSDYLMRKSRDVGEKDIDEEVHGFSNDNVNPVPYSRSPVAPPSFAQQVINPIGMEDNVHEFSSNNVDLVQKRHKQIINSEDMDDEVHGFSNANVNFAQHASWDISHNGVRPDVWEVVDSAVNPVPYHRSSAAPETRHKGDFDYSHSAPYGRI